MPPRKAARQRLKTFAPQNLPRTHAALAAEVPYHFEVLELSVTLVDSHGWHALHVIPNVVQFEHEHGLEQPRFVYNQRCMLQAAREQKPIVGQLAGFSDVFAPVVTRDGVQRMLIAGPFRGSLLTSSEIQERWQALTGRQGNIADPEFADYVAKSISTPVYDGADLEGLKRLMSAFAAVIGQGGNPEDLAKALDLARNKLADATFVRRMWVVAHSMINSLTARVWRSTYLLPQRAELKLTRLPEHAMVGLIAGNKAEADPVDEAIRRHEFQRACVRLAASRGDTVAGPVGNHGILFLLPDERSKAASRAKIAELAERAAALGQQRYRLRLQFGTSMGTRHSTLPAHYRSALGAAEQALSLGVVLVQATDAAPHGENAARNLRLELAKLGSDGVEGLLVRFDRYIDVVASQSRYRLEPVAVHLAAGLERLAEPFLRSHAMDRKAWNDMWRTLDDAAESAITLHDLFAAYRTAVVDLEAALRQPGAAHQERNLRRAVEFIREHIAEPLSRDAVARVAGFEPHYFSRLFKRREKLTFEKYVTKLRIERAQQMLTRTPLTAERVAQLCGFSSSQYFHKVFKRAVGETPLEYKSRPS